MRAPCLAVVLTFTLLACDKDDAKTSPSASATTSAAPAPTPSASSAPPTAAATATSSAPLPKCPAGLTGNAAPAYCIKIPASYSVREARVAPTRGSIDYQTGTSTDHLMVTFDETPLASLAKDTEGELKFGGDKLEKKGDLPGGNKWFQGSHEDYERVVTLVKGPGTLTLKCSFAYQPKHAPPQDAIDACKSIVVP